jgi:hypothetical protein
MNDKPGETPLRGNSTLNNRDSGAVDPDDSSYVERFVQLISRNRDLEFSIQGHFIKSPKLPQFRFTPEQRAVLLQTPRLQKSMRNKLERESSVFTIDQITGILQQFQMTLREASPVQRHAILDLVEEVYDELERAVASLVDRQEDERRERKARASQDLVYQFKVTLVQTDPTIWRRIVVRDCSLSRFHLLIQCAMGWENDHHYEFQIDNRGYCGPGIDAPPEGFACNTRVSEIIPTTRRKLKFDYLYDFGDGWLHEIEYEGSFARDPDKTYPLCVDGERACPPEDSGGVYAYAHFLACRDHPDDAASTETLDWFGSFDPEPFDPVLASKIMQRNCRPAKKTHRRRRRSES